MADQKTPTTRVPQVSSWVYERDWVRDEMVRASTERGEIRQSMERLETAVNQFREETITEVVKLKVRSGLGGAVSGGIAAGVVLLGTFAKSWFINKGD